MLKIIVQIEPD